MTISPETTAGELARQFPATLKLFRRRGIAVCCGGHRTLGDICRSQSIEFAELAAELSDVTRRSPARPTWNDRPLAELTAHLVDAFHEPLRQELPRLAQLAHDLQGHGDNHRHALAVVHYELTLFSAELEAQMATEERELFPMLVAAEAGGRVDPALARLIADARVSHVEARETLRLLHQSTGGYTPPATACGAVRSLYRSLRDLEALMQLHVHLESNVLFARASALMSAAGLEN